MSRVCSHCFRETEDLDEVKPEWLVEWERETDARDKAKRVHEATRTPAARSVVGESLVVNECLLSLGGRSDCRVWRNNTGTLKDRNGRPVSYGLVGSADILGIANGGRFLAFECKRPVGGTWSAQQRAFAKMVERFGGLYALVRSAGEAMRALDAYLAPKSGRCDCFNCDGERGERGEHEECEYHGHHCDKCHREKLCTLPECVAERA